jgi:hypothetical protein
MNPKPIVCFNTGAGYTEFGQRIAVFDGDDGNLLMVDFDRGLQYEFERTEALEPSTDPFHVAKAIHRMYLNNEGFNIRNLDDSMAIRQLRVEDFQFRMIHA